MTSTSATVWPEKADLSVVDNVLMLMMFMSGIFFNAETMPESWRGLFQFNPMLQVIDAYRAVLLHNSWPDWAGLGYVLLVSAPLMLLAVLLLRRFERHYPKLIF